MPDADGFSAAPSAFRFGGTVEPPANWVAPRTLADLVADFEAVPLEDRLGSVEEKALALALERVGPVQADRTVYLYRHDSGFGDQVIVLPLPTIRLAREVPVPDPAPAAGR